MCKITSTIVGIITATLLIYISVVTLSNQAFAQCNGTECHKQNPWGGLVASGIAQAHVGQVLGDTEKTVDITVTGDTNHLVASVSHAGLLGLVPVNALNNFAVHPNAGHETQLAKIVGKAGHSLGDVCLSCFGH
jgi:hypothetical protein